MYKKYDEENTIILLTCIYGVCLQQNKFKILNTVCIKKRLLQDFRLKHKMVVHIIFGRKIALETL